MRNYVDEIDESFVNDVVMPFLTKNWFAKYVTIKKHGPYWKVMYTTKDKYHVFFLDNFLADFGTRHMWCSALDRRWRVALYKKFGTEYYLDLNKYLLEQCKSKNKDQAKRAMDDLKYIEALKQKEDMNTK